MPVQELLQKLWDDKSGRCIDSFDITFDCSQYSCLDILGYKYLNYQMNHLLETLADNLEGSDSYQNLL